MFLKNGDHFSGCRILSRCGKGAYGVVYLAENAVGQKIVIKVVTSTEHSDRELRGLRNYLQLSGTHPHLLRIFHIGEIPDGFYYTMEAADNLNPAGMPYQPATLGNLLRNGRKFTPEEAVRITRELLDGVEAVHRARLVHRDIKPDNIIFVNGTVKLSDPGLLTEAGMTVSLAGTPGFIPPEIIDSARPATPGDDLYAIGKVFYCMITDNPPGDYPHLPVDMRLEVRRQIFPALSRMCNRNPAKRFADTAEFLKNLPETIKEPTWLERQRTAFRDWKTLNGEKYRLYVILTCTVLALLLLGGIAAGIHHWRRRMHLAACEQETRAFLALNAERRDLIGFQLEVFLPDRLDRYRELKKSLEENVRTKRWDAAAAVSRGLSTELRSAAEKLLPKVPTDPLPDSEAFAISGAAHGFLTTPLSVYLPEGTKKQFTKQLSGWEKTQYEGWRGPLAGREWASINRSDYPMVFVPPGAVRLNHNQRLVKIPYPFWICRNETLHSHFSRMMHIAPQRSPYAGTPVERVLWNDVLYFCWILTGILQDDHFLPPGYIVRPPNEAEWEYAAKNAWLGEDTAPLEKRAVIKSNSGGRTQPAGTKQASRLGLVDMFGNVEEYVLPLEELPKKNSVITRGGSFMSLEKGCSHRTMLLKYQNMPYQIGFRFVIAPGTMDYFDRHFFLGGADRLETGGRVFELIGENLSCYDWEKSNELCRLLGGRLAEPDTPELLAEISRAMPLAPGSWGCFLGGQKTGNEWHWISSGRKIDFGSWTKSSRRSQGSYLMLRNKRWQAVSSERSGIFLCQWDAKSFPRRNEQLRTGKKLPRELMRFSAGDRNYLLLEGSMGWYTARRVCELLGGRLACLDTPELRKAVMDEVKTYGSYRIMLGGYAKRDQWLWLSGKKIDFPLKQDPDVPIPTQNRNFVTLVNGEFCNSQYGSLVLCEWPASMASSK